MKIVAATDIGLNRKTNQDAFYISPDGAFVIVADGMGGHADGEIASNAAVTAIRTHFEKRRFIDGCQSIEIRDSLKRAVELANEIVFDMSDSDEEKGMGTTIVMAYFYEGVAYIAYVGDSRAYFINGDSKMRQITKDHNVVNSLIELGKITEEQAHEHPQRNVLTRAVGTDRIVEVDTMEIQIEKGAYILLCTDGLTNAISDFEIEQLIKSGSTPKDLCDLANRRSGKDNVTVAIATA